MMGPQLFSEAEVAWESCLKKTCSSLEGGELVVVLRLYLMFGRMFFLHLLYQTALAEQVIIQVSCIGI